MWAMPSKIDDVIGRANQLMADEPMELGEFMRRNFEQVQAWVDDQRPELPDWGVFARAVFVELGIGIATEDGQKREHRTDTVRRTWNRSKEILAKRIAKAERRGERTPLLPGLTSPRVRPAPEHPKLAMQPEPERAKVPALLATPSKPSLPELVEEQVEAPRPRFRSVSYARPVTAPENPNEEK